MRNLVGAPLPAELAERVQAVIGQIRSGSLGPKNSGPVLDVIGQMTEAVMRHFFVTPLHTFGMGARVRGVVEFGIGSSLKTIRYGMGKVIPHLKEAQFRQLAQFLDDSLHEPSPR